MAEYEELAKELHAALVAVRTEIPSDVLGKAADLRLSPEDYRAMATTLFIETHKKNGDKGKYEGPSTEGQQKYLAGLAMEKDGANDTIAAFLESVDKKSMEELNSSEASSLIDNLKTLKKKELPRKARAPRY